MCIESTDHPKHIAVRSFQRMAARNYWLARGSRILSDQIYFQQEAAELSKYARQMMLIEPFNEETN